MMLLLKATPWSVDPEKVLLAELNETLTPLGRLADAGKATVAPEIPPDAGSDAVPPAVGESICVVLELDGELEATEVVLTRPLQLTIVTNNASKNPSGRRAKLTEIRSFRLLAFSSRRRRSAVSCAR